MKENFRNDLIEIDGVLLTPIPGFKATEYLAHTPTGQLYSLISDKWLLQNAKGTGDNNSYLMTTIKNEDGKFVRMYLHEIIMSSHMGIKKEEWRKLGLECDHINSEDTKDCSISNLRLVSSVDNKKNSRKRSWNRTRLTQEVANELRKEFKNNKGSKIDWYVEKGRELGVTARSIQNIILDATYKEIEVAV